MGNLIILAKVYQQLPAGLNDNHLAENPELLHHALFKALNEIAGYLGVADCGVLPCTSTQAQLRIRYANGVQVRGEHKSSLARRDVPIEEVMVDYCRKPVVYKQVLDSIAQADILVMAPGSLYSSIIPVFQVTAIAEAVRKNKNALKVLVSNLWVQAGETDLLTDDPQRKYRVSDMLTAYENNIPGGTAGLFNEVLCISMQEVPSSILQKYAVEGKIPIYLDREVVAGKDYLPIECGIFSERMLREKGAIQHDPDFLARVIRTLYITRKRILPQTSQDGGRIKQGGRKYVNYNAPVLCCRYQSLKSRIHSLEYRLPAGIKIDKNTLKQQFISIIWKHHDISLAHLDHCAGVQIVARPDWPRNQRWDNVYSFFDPEDRLIKIRVDVLQNVSQLETAFLIALGQSLLGRYCRSKMVKDVVEDGEYLGRVFHLYLADERDWQSFFSYDQLVNFLLLARMQKTSNKNHFIRMLNGQEGFSPPGMLMGLLYVWYLDNRMAYYLEYKMSIIKIKKSPLIPEQEKICLRREQLISFCREVVFA
ncbi:MAG: hypothetical protein CSB24_06580 [Deltaproteobacteria bacterium]|nr:MAG: hypothetical protein CSB24_06580 [Deltaproteobacteria bacterium]